ncbi:MAG: UDPGP type 1 family protein [Leptospirales bacterium]|nr:UDPGP type 1 family protein [Leptospirales bacterium]
MVRFSGYDDVIMRVYEHRQEQVFKYWDDLSDRDKKHLLDELKDVDLALMERLYAASGKHHEHLQFEPPLLVPLPETDEQKEERAMAINEGRESIKNGHVAAFIVAGGQASRLGYNSSKGIFPIGQVSGKSLFQLHGEKILASSRKYGAEIPWLIMTSVHNHDETSDYFKKMDFFGLDEKDIFIFPQNMIPSLDSNGKLVLETPWSLFKNPDGHGGSFKAMSSSGALMKIKERDIRIISYFQVDNPLVKIIDPEFIGYHILFMAEASSKAIPKAYPEEKVGVFVKFSDGKTGVVEYSDLPPEKITARAQDGSLLYSAGNIAVHLFNLDFIERLTSGESAALPFHTARKTLSAHEGEIDGFKFEKFIFDALPMAEHTVVMETRREDEFAPVKNASGPDSPETSQKLMSELHRKWLLSRGIGIPEKVSVVEISPLTALEAEDIPHDIAIPNTQEVEL